MSLKFGLSISAFQYRPPAGLVHSYLELSNTADVRLGRASGVIQHARQIIVVLLSSHIW